MRSDLLALTREAIASLANLGLVKRAEREIAAGEGPKLEEDSAGVVTGTFPDGVVTKLPPLVGLQKGACSCGATAVCRHRVAVAIAYPSWARASATTSEATRGEDANETSWSPGAIDDDALGRALGKRIVDRARATIRGGAVAELTRDPPSAKLATCTVRFLVPGDLAYARCDCALASGCEHVAIAVWAFRAADAGGSTTVQLGAPSSTAIDPLGAALDLAREIVVEGVVHVGTDVSHRFARARAALEEARFTWPATLLDDLEDAILAYRARSARHRPSVIADAIASLFARARVLEHERDGRAGELPARFVLGADVARETLLDHARFVSLGARVDAPTDATRAAEVYLADPDTGVVLVLRKTWSFPEGTVPEEGPALARRSIAARITLGALASGQLVSKAIKRRANRSLTLSATRSVQTSVTPQSGAWGELPRTLVAAGYAALAADLRARTPRLVAPCTLADSIRVVPVGDIHAIGWSAGEQALVASLRDADGASLTIVRRHRRTAPHAIDALAAALSNAPRFLAGEVTLGPSGLVLDPVGVSTDSGVVVPDLSAELAPTKLLVASLPTAHAPHDDAIARARGLLAEAAHLGLAHAPASFFARVAEASRDLESLGLAAAAERTKKLAETRSIDAWASASIRLSLLLSSS